MAKKNRNVLLVSVLFFLAAGGGSYLFREPILTRVATFLVVSDPLHKADAMEILGGGEPGRARKAAELYHEGWAPRIFITKAEHTTATEELRHYGISAAEDHEIKCAVCLLVASICSTSLPSSSPLGLMRCPRTNLGPGSCMRRSKRKVAPS